MCAYVCGDGRWVSGWRGGDGRGLYPHAQTDTESDTHAH